jgi:hypothetical protein
MEQGGAAEEAAARTFKFQVKFNSNFNYKLGCNQD